jgi:hypothetical protein
LKCRASLQTHADAIMKTYDELTRLQQQAEEKLTYYKTTPLFFENALESIAERTLQCRDSMKMMNRPEQKTCEPIKDVTIDAMFVANFKEDLLGAVRIIVRIFMKDDGKGTYNLNCFGKKTTGAHIGFSDKTIDDHQLKRMCYGPFYKIVSDNDTQNMFGRPGTIGDTGLWSTFNQVLNGYKISLFGYGYSGSGKTHTLFGDENNKGLAFHAVEYYTSKGYVVTVKDIVEYYGVAKVTKKPVQKVNQVGKTFIQQEESLELAEFKIQHIPPVGNLDAIKFRALLNELEPARQEQKRISETINNKTSSRSHLCITLQVIHEDGIRTGSREGGTLVLVDMGGRENPLDIYKNTYISSLPSSSGGSYLRSASKFDEQIAYGANKGGKKLFISNGSSVVQNTYTITGYFFKSLMDTMSADAADNIKVGPDAHATTMRIGALLKRLEGRVSDDALKYTIYPKALDVVRTCCEGFYINETINHLTRKLRKANGVDEVDTNISQLKITDLEDPDAYADKLRYEIGSGVGGVPNACSKFDKFIDSLLVNDHPDKPSKLVMVACVRSENDKHSAKYLEFSERTLEFANDVASTISTVKPVKGGAYRTRSYHGRESSRRIKGHGKL